MGDRALVQFIDSQGEERSPVVYLHNDGYRVKELLKKTREIMAGREDDVPYTVARFVGVCCEARPGNLSLGIWNGDEKPDSHGDAGVFEVHLGNDAWRVVMSGGYGFDDGKSEELV